jgi:uncharacterized protein YeaO (DUF488 family)
MRTQETKDRLRIFTIGHSTRPIEEFVELLRHHGVQQLIDIRTIPKSRRNPQFNGEALAASVRRARIGYTHLKQLGGLRHARSDSVNPGWHNASFRGFADYMQTPEFEEGLNRAIQLATARPAALMCAEAVPWRCHRSLVADALLARGIGVDDILGSGKPKAHRMTPFARLRGTRITYPAEGRAGPSNGHGRRRAMIRIARVYEESGEKSGTRYLVERLWPRGVKKEALELDGWLKDVAPSDALRRWFGHKPERWEEFQRKYLAELRANPATWTPILEAARRGNVTLLYSARDAEHNNALALERFLAAKLQRHAP